MNKPIGIFDSGVGGLTVAEAVQNLLPRENLVYYGDTRNAPYGDKSAETIRRLSERITRFLLAKECKVVVVACNTASALAFDHLRRRFPGVLLMNVIDPVIQGVSAAHYRKVGVIATRGTIRSRVYHKRLLAQKANLTVVSKATPLLAPLVEEGFAGTDISRGVMQRYLSADFLTGLDALILGCTHYPLLKDDLIALLGTEIAMLDSSQWLAAALHDRLESEGLLNHEGPGRQEFYLSEMTPAFRRISRLFFGRKRPLMELALSG